MAVTAEEALKSVDAFLWTLARKYAAWNAPADDLFQEARLAFVLAYPRYDPTRGALSTFAHVHGMSGIRCFLRSKALLIRKPAWIWESGDREDVTASFTDAFCNEEYEPSLGCDPLRQAEHEIYVEQILSELTSHEAQTIRLWLQGYSDQDISNMRGTSREAVRQNRTRAVTKLRKGGAMLALMSS